MENRTFHTIYSKFRYMVCGEELFQDIQNTCFLFIITYISVEMMLIAMIIIEKIQDHAAALDVVGSSKGVTDGSMEGELDGMVSDGLELTDGELDNVGECDGSAVVGELDGISVGT